MAWNWRLCATPQRKPTSRRADMSDIDTNAALLALLDGLHDPIVYCDNHHCIRYMNTAARTRFACRPAEVGRSLFDCHNDASNRRIVAVFESFCTDGLCEELLRDGDKERIIMRSVRDAAGDVIGYYERYEPPTKGPVT
jgi:PAS domain-containing protein